MTLVEFLNARLADDEQSAQDAAGDERHQQWALNESPDYNEGAIVGYALRVLAEVAAKRAVIDVTFRYEAKIDGEWACCHSADEIRAGVCPAIPVNEIETLRIMAAVYADHPDYDQSWAVEA